MSIAHQVSGSVHPTIPSNWIYASKQFSTHSDAMNENIVIYRPMKETFSSKTTGDVIKIVVDSPSSFLRPQRSYLSGKITWYNADNTVNSTVNNADAGAMMHFLDATVRVSGKIAESIDNYGEHVSQQYAFESAARRKYLSHLEGVGRDDIFHTNGSFTFRHHVEFGVMQPTNGNPMPLCLLPGQAIELSFTLNSPHMAATNAATGAYFTVSDIRYVAQLVTPHADFLASAWEGIRKGHYLEYDYVATTQTFNNGNGATINQFIIPLANSRVVGLTHRFRDDSKYQANTGDKSLIYDTANLKSWRYQLGGWRLLLTEDFKIEDAMISGALSVNDNASYAAEDVDLDNYMTKKFTLRCSFQSSDKDVASALNLIGTDGNLRFVCEFSAPLPTTTALITSVFTHRTLLIGATVDII
ncbi:hypothetical protein BC832DRAFT_591259 [Gaertneriomyces semiglobifer]|nr:hypothetical protein BC832DRAFT_591259 [Gaertneriomyces semiglobifer]